VLLLVLALLWVAILVPIAVRYFRDSGTERSIESFYAEREMLSRQERAMSPEYHYERPEPPPSYEPETPRRPRLTVVHPDDTVGSLQARGTWDDWSHDYDYDDDTDAQRRRREKNRYAAAYSSVPGDRFGAAYNVPYEENGLMRVRRRRVFVTLLVACLAFTAFTFVSTSSIIVNAAFLAWAALVGFVVLALVSLGLGYMGTSSLRADFVDEPDYEPIVPLPRRENDYDDDFGDVDNEPQWRRESAPRRALG
jgi:hypothetical protein